MRFRSLVRAAVIAIVVLGCAPIFAPGPDPSTPPPPSIYVSAPEIVVQVRNQTASAYTVFMRAGTSGPWRNLGTAPPGGITHFFVPRYLLQIDDQFAFRAFGGQRIQYFVTPPLKVDVPAIVLLLQQPKVPLTQMRI